MRYARTPRERKGARVPRLERYGAACHGNGCLPSCAKVPAIIFAPALWTTAPVYFCVNELPRVRVNVIVVGVVPSPGPLISPLTGSVGSLVIVNVPWKWPSAFCVLITSSPLKRLALISHVPVTFMLAAQTGRS